MNIENFKHVLSQLETLNKSWNSFPLLNGPFPCSAILSFAAGDDELGAKITRSAFEFLGLTKNEAEYIMSPDRVIDDLRDFLRFYEVNPTGFDSDGRDFTGCKRPD